MRISLTHESFKHVLEPDKIGEISRFAVVSVFRLDPV